MCEQYSLLRQDFLSIAEPFIDCGILDQLKQNYAHEIDSRRKLSSVKDLKTFIRLLEKRDIISYKNIKELQSISKLFIRKSALESKLLDYENWLKTVPTSHLCDMYQHNEIASGSSQGAENVETNQRTTSEPECSNLPQSSMHSETVSFNRITQTLHCSQENKTNNLDDKRKSLQQTVLLQLKDRLGRSWRNVARHLEIRECEIDAIQSKYPFDLKEQSYEMLKIYISQSNTEEWAINLIRALEKGRRKDLKELTEDLTWKTSM
ncbi:fas-associated death domain protein [Linepithema humile]|uniref:fas-associated death domain protein n=1 Tax=Linepithema humile TaxID=83485 RepID=UPI00062372D0|nr:PREDICTED: fas-associated death domain protein [Linepithema humile]XP_012229437.1 PREDICTED: fas-associated death domain protein [Linepithema humile]